MFKDKTRLQVLNDILRQTGVKAPELSALKQIDPAVDHLWTWFARLGRRRPSGRPITWSEMASFFALNGIRPQKWEVEALEALDDLYIETKADNRASRVVSGAGAMKAAAPGEKRKA